MTNNDGPMVFLFSQDSPPGHIAYWVKGMDQLVFELKNESCRARRISDFVDVHYAAQAEDIVGFKLCQASLAMRFYAQFFDMQPDERIPLGRFLQYYASICYIGDWKQGAGDREFVASKFEEFRRLVGDATVLQPAHAMTLPL